MIIIYKLILAQRVQYCRTPQNKVGKCIILSECLSLKDFLVDHPKTDENLDYLRQFICGFEGITSKVCCQLEGNINEIPLDNKFKEDIESTTAERKFLSGIITIK